MLHVPTLVLEPSNFNRHSTEKSSLFLLHFLSFSFSFLIFFLYEFFLFFLLFFSFPFFFSFLFFFIPFSRFIFSSFLSFLSFGAFSPLFFGSSLTKWSREETSSPFPHAICVVHVFLHFSFYLFYSFYCIIHHMTNCEAHIQMHHMALVICHSLRVPCGIPLTMPYVIRHPSSRKT